MAKYRSHKPGTWTFSQRRRHFVELNTFISVQTNILRERAQHGLIINDRLKINLELSFGTYMITQPQENT